MNRNQKKFDEIKYLLIEKLRDRIEYSKDDDGTEYLNIKNSEFWMSNVFGEFVVGYGFNHTHFSDEYENLEDGVSQAFELLTNRIKTTNYIKGQTIFKTIIEIEYENSKPKNFGSSSVIFYPFWKKTEIKSIISEKIIDKHEIEKESNKILNFELENLQI